ncbi:HemK2/MTQ2 family protein methyltransferase [Flavitalea antarctica]
MRSIVKYLVSHTYKPVLEVYLSSTRTYRYQGIELEIPAGVFHPRFFFSTKFLLNQVRNEKFSDQSVLELGAGSGLISIYAASRGGIVTATDINPVAVSCLRKNMHKNKVMLEVLEADMFAGVPVKPYQFVLLNPPYYKKEPASVSDYAWYCGKNGEYFYRLFESLGQYLDSTSKILMVLCEGCDLEMIHHAAANNQFKMECIATGDRFLEKHFIYNISSLKWVN